MHIDITTQWTDGIMKNFAPIKLRFIWFIWFIGIRCKYYSDLFRKYITNDSPRQTGIAFSPTSTAMAMAASTLDGSWHAKAKISQRKRISELPAASWVVKSRGLGPKMLRVTSQGEDLRRNWTWDWNCSVLHSDAAGTSVPQSYWILPNPFPTIQSHTASLLSIVSLATLFVTVKRQSHKLHSMCLSAAAPCKAIANIWGGGANHVAVYIIQYSKLDYHPFVPNSVRFP